MAKSALEVLRVYIGTCLVVLGSISIAGAQVAPNPPTGLSVDGQTTEPSPLPPGVVFFDDFNYQVERSWTTTGQAGAIFSNAGWSSSKCINGCENGRGAAAYLYTTTSIPGYTGRMPGTSGSGRVLCLEAKPTSIQLANGGSNQTDFYLQYGRPNSRDVPADVWYQFWYYTLDFGSYASRFSGGNKLIYPSPNGTYSVPTGMVPYMIILGTSSYETTGVPQFDIGYGSSLYMVNRPQFHDGNQTGADFRNASQYPSTRDMIGTNLNRTGGYMTANRWYLVKIHVNHSGPQGQYELWLREMGGAWQKVSEWFGGVTPGFSWPTIPDQRAGISTIRVPSTWGKANSDPTNYDAWAYMVDFMIARSESDLPVYSSY